MILWAWGGKVYTYMTALLFFLFFFSFNSPQFFYPSPAPTASRTRLPVKLARACACNATNQVLTNAWTTHRMAFHVCTYVLLLSLLTLRHIDTRKKRYTNSDAQWYDLCKVHKQKFLDPHERFFRHKVLVGCLSAWARRGEATSVRTRCSPCISMRGTYIYVLTVIIYLQVNIDRQFYSEGRRYCSSETNISESLPRWRKQWIR